MERNVTEQLSSLSFLESNLGHIVISYQNKSVSSINYLGEKVKGVKYVKYGLAWQAPIILNELLFFNQS